MLATGWAYSAQRIRNDREQTIQSESERLQSVAVALSTTTFAMLSDGVGSAVVRANEIESLGGLESVSERDLTPALGTALMGGEYVRSVFIADSTRFARGGRGGAYDVAEGRPAWFNPTVAPETDIWVGPPVADPDRAAADSLVVPVAQRVRTAGRSDVWAGALFDFRAFDSLRKQLGSPGAILLLRRDGSLLVSTQDISAALVAGRAYASGPLFQQAARDLGNGWDRGVVHGFAPAVGAPLLFGWARVRQYPVLVAAGRPVAAVLAAWQRRTITTLVVTGAFSALVLAMTLLLNHSLRSLRSRELHYRTLFNNTAFSVFISEGDRFIAANDTALRMFGIRDEEAVRELTPDSFSPPEQPDGRPSNAARRSYIEQAMRAGNATFEWLHRRVDNGETFPAEVDMNVITQGKTVLRLSVVHDLTEAKRAERERRESEGRYRALVDAMPEAVIVHRGGEMLFGNAAARTLIGAGPDQNLQGVPVTSFALEPDRKLLTERTRAILEHGVAAEPRETRIRRLDGSVIWVEVQGVRVDYDGAPAAQTLLRDINARKQQEEAEAARVVRMQRQSDMLLRVASHSSSERLTGLRPALEGICVDTSQVMGADRVTIWLVEDDDATLRCRAFYERGSGVRQGELPKIPASEALHLPALRNERVMDGAATFSVEQRARELRQAMPGVSKPSHALLVAGIRRSGELIGTLTIGQLESERAWLPDEVNFAGEVADQVAQLLLHFEREQVLADLQVLAGELTRIQNEERRRIGRELHDSTGQTLAALELDLARLSELTKSLAEKPRELLENAVRLAHQCSSEIRTASYLLHPPLLDELGLVSALRWLSDGLRERSGLEVRLELPEAMPRLTPANELTLFRVAQEALTNVQRHSASPWVGLRLTVLAHAVSLEVEDAGRGMAGRERGTAVTLGVGLAGMRERIRQVGGTFAVESTATGTRIRASVPLQALNEVRSA